jgi:hypothetical protein
MVKQFIIKETLYIIAVILRELNDSYKKIWSVVITRLPDK